MTGCRAHAIRSHVTAEFHTNPRPAQFANRVERLAACWFPRHCWAVTHVRSSKCLLNPYRMNLSMPSETARFSYIKLCFIFNILWFSLYFTLFFYIQTTDLPNKMFNPLSKTPTLSLLIGKYVHHLGAYGSCLKF